jgi:hypothetical protein
LADGLMLAFQYPVKLCSGPTHHSVHNDREEATHVLLSM